MSRVFVASRSCVAIVRLMAALAVVYCETAAPSAQQPPQSPAGVNREDPNGAGGAPPMPPSNRSSTEEGAADAVVHIDGPQPPIAPDVITRDDRGRATVRAVRLASAIRIDGRLDEEIYQTVTAITGLVQLVPNEGAPETERTEAWVMYDDSNIYVSARCWDSAPESDWVANEMRRDTSQLRQNDQFGFLFDTFYDRRNGFQFYTNPLGAIADAYITGEGNPNSDWNTVWNVRTGRFDGGWTAEFQIPFKSLRYRPGPSQVWGIQFRRATRRKNEWTYLTRIPISVAGASGTSGILRVSAAATLVGLEVPPGSKNLEVKPYGISGVSTDRTVSPAVSNDLDGELGLDVKYGITQNLTLDLTYNTDFAQVEVDEQQINLTRFSLLFPEKREFFLEGRGLFDFARGGSIAGVGTGGTTAAPQLFFSRQIGLYRGRVVPILAGARMTGKVGRTSIGALNIQTEQEPVSATEATNFTVLRVKQDILRRSNVGVMFTGRSASTVVPGASNTAYGVDASLAFYENISFLGYYARTDTSGLAGRQDSYQARFDYGADRYGFTAEHLFVADDFSPEIGFLPRDDMRRTYLYGRFSPRPRSIPSVRRFVVDASLDYILSTAGYLETRQQGVSFETEFQNSDRIIVEANRAYELLVSPFRIAPGVTIPPGGYDFDSVRGSFQLGQQHRVSGTVSLEHGGFYGGKQTAVGYTQGRVEVTRQLSLEPSASINWIDLPYGAFTTQLYRTRITYTFTPRMFVSSLLQYNSSNDTASANARFRWEYSPGSELFVVYTEDQDAHAPGRRFPELLNRAIVVKVNRLLRF